MSTQPKTFLTPEEYPEIDGQAEYKSKSFAREMFAMSDATGPHNLSAVDVSSGLHEQTRGRGCRVYDVRVQVRTTGLYAYSDVVALCGEPKYLDETRDILLNPSLIAEVLSPSTKAYNRGRKFEHRRTIESPAEYRHGASDRMHADSFTRAPSVLPSAGNPSDVLELPFIGCRLVLADIYDLVF
jgi:Uma2 family endonuclease